VIIYDYLANERLRSQRRPDADASRNVEQSTGGTAHRSRQPMRIKLRPLIVKRAKRKDGARLKGGDPFIFGRGGEEAEDLFDMASLSRCARRDPLLPGTPNHYAGSTAYPSGSYA